MNLSFPLIMVTLIMLAAGMLGGVVNFYLTAEDDPAGRNLGKSVSLGIVASLLVPLFLNMISSEIVKTISKSASIADAIPETLVFLGFCLVAAVSSRAFIQTLSDRILKEAKAAVKVAEKAKGEASRADEKAELALHKQTERDADEEVGKSVSKVQLDEDQRKVLEAFTKRSFALRTRTGLAMDAGMTKDQVDKILRDLVDQGLAAMTLTRENKNRWYLTEKGRLAIGIPTSQDT